MNNIRLNIFYNGNTISLVTNLECAKSIVAKYKELVSNCTGEKIQVIYEDGGTCFSIGPHVLGITYGVNKPNYSEKALSLLDAQTRLMKQQMDDFDSGESWKDAEHE